MPKGFLPNADAALLAWSANFSARLSESGASYGISPEEAADYAAKHAAYADAFEAAANPGTRSRSDTVRKNEARAALRGAAGNLASIIKGQPTVTDAGRILLGLVPRPAGRAALIGRPAAAPFLAVLAVSGRSVRLRLSDADSARTGKPAGVLGAMLFSYTAPAAAGPPAPTVEGLPPADLQAWRFEGHTTRTTIELAFPSDLAPGSQVWLTARWLSPRLQSGPIATPVSTHLGGGVSLGSTLRLAA
ncbi:MAG TPA: hypothetical protein VH475_07010 [Tepidisphaeraceae bacterium]|jgi:hypothetical protein